MKQKCLACFAPDKDSGGKSIFNLTITLKTLGRRKHRNENNIDMKFTVGFLIFIFLITAVRADLVIQSQSILWNETNIFTTKIHGDKIRDDSDDDSGISFITDANTGNMTILWNKSKTFIKRSGAKEMEWIKKMNKQSGGAKRQLLDTGKSEKVGKYNAEIYTWSDTNGDTVNYWVAKDFPNYKHVKPYLATFDKANFAGTGKDTPFELSKLPGMVVKSESVSPILTHTRTLISVKEEPVDTSVFEIPKDYKETDPFINVQSTNSNQTPK